jgi:hypothetical protein
MPLAKALKAIMPAPRLLVLSASHGESLASAPARTC